MKRVLSFLARVLLLHALVGGPLVLVRWALETAGLTRAPADANEVRFVSLGDGLVMRSTAAAFRGGSIAWCFGGLVLDLRDATLAAGGADLSVVTLMGGTVVIVPATWPVTLAHRNILGGAQPSPEPQDASGPELRIKATTVMGGLRIERRVPGSSGTAAAPASPKAG
ncbi:MAG TPA: hypothetical protein VNN10_07820 [Dehalococcoidia bacterium]|nr:hypothetical protein [Dehalococcoidia bacterium]